VSRSINDLQSTPAKKKKASEINPQIVDLEVISNFKL
jgi:hypothetical protein